MKESVLEVLMYLFENYIDAEEEPEPDRFELKEELERAGFGEGEIDNALEWLDGLRSSENGEPRSAPTERAIRVFDKIEKERMDVDCQGYLLYLEQIGILSASQRELVIDRVMALGSEEIDTEQIKWVVLMVLFSQPGQQSAFERMENLVFEDNLGAVH